MPLLRRAPRFFLLLPKSSAIGSKSLSPSLEPEFFHRRLLLESEESSESLKFPLLFFFFDFNLFFDERDFDRLPFLFARRDFFLLLDLSESLSLFLFQRGERPWRLGSLSLSSLSLTLF